MQISINDIVEKGIGEIKCPFCGSTQWTNNKNITAQFPIDSNNNHCAGNIIPTIEMICSQCGYVACFNMDVIVSKVVTKDKK